MGRKNANVMSGCARSNGTAQFAKRSSILMILLFVALLCSVPQCHAQSLTVSVTKALPTLTVPASGSSSDAQSMTVTTSWSGWIGFIIFTGQTCVYMTSPMTGTGGNPDTIPLGNIMVTPSGGSTSAINASTACGVAGATQLNSFSGWSWSSGSTTTQVQVQVSNASNLAADSYHGSIYVIATTN